MFNSIRSKTSKKLANRIIDIPFAAIYSSPSKRALDTAKILRGSHSIPIFEVEDFLEMNLGNWEGMKKVDIKEIYAEDYEEFWNEPHLFNGSSGEQFEDVYKRVVDGLQNIIYKSSEGDNILIVTHAIAKKNLMRYIEGRTLDKLWDPPVIQNTGLSIIEYAHNKFRIIEYSDTKHLISKLN
nr:histidine phosphatase family protein [Bacillus cereus]